MGPSSVGESLMVLSLAVVYDVLFSLVMAELSPADTASLCWSRELLAEVDSSWIASREGVREREGERRLLGDRTIMGSEGLETVLLGSWKGPARLGASPSLASASKRLVDEDVGGVSEVLRTRPFEGIFDVLEFPCFRRSCDWLEG